MLVSLLLLPLLSAASVIQYDSHDHSHANAKRLSSTWYHPSDHPVHALFKRDGSTDGIQYAPVGSDGMLHPSRPGTPDVNAMPSAWTKALSDALARGAIPNTPVAKATGDNPVYPNGLDPNSPEVCSATEQCRIPGDIWDAPDGHIGISFDDGPQPATDALVAFLETNDQPATHFMIGTNILYYPQEFQKTFDQGGDIAVHTWTHPYMTTLSNLHVVAELGWTMELIHNSTGGRVPKFWRPPYGDSDTRVTAIAREVFGLQTVIWNQDTEDWSLTTGGTTTQAVNSSMHKWLTGSKSPGLIILEHELSSLSVGAFMAAYPVMKSNNWVTESLAQLIDGSSAYRNADSSSGPVLSAGILASNISLSTNSSLSSGSSSVPSSTRSVRLVLSLPTVTEPAPTQWTAISVCELHRIHREQPELICQTQCGFRELEHEPWGTIMSCIPVYYADLDLMPLFFGTSFNDLYIA
ncbi:hypothetical protein B0H10DRAFT_1774810 [Mycena sp. CBHHK59/15]|nr:hypothetical protein B0H10DRAFT_1774810 [Mycena sp. CBHHK59/15]